MNAIISFCHFCEHHGPSVVFCTQAYRDQTSFQSLRYTTDLKPCKLDLEDGSVLNKDPDKSWKYGAPSEEILDKPPLSHGPAETCSACRSFQHNKAGFISNDDGAKVSYVSSQYPVNPDLYNLIRQASTRSLSCEVCLGREGPIYFGDENRGHVLSYTFFLRDNQARGFQRWYSILVLMKDKMFLLNSWPFLVHHIQQTIESLQNESSKIYECEGGSIGKLSSIKTVSVDGLRRQRAAGPPRPLTELVGSTAVWQQLHTSFTWLLKAGALRLQERLVEGPPLRTSCLPAEDGLTVRELHHVLGSATFRRLLHHLLIGHRIFIKGSNESLVTSLIDSLKVFLPQWCFQSLKYVTEPSDMNGFNIIGMSLKVNSEHIPSSHSGTCTITLIQKDNPERADDIIGGVFVCNQNRQLLLRKFLKYYVQISEDRCLCPRPPLIVSKIDNAVNCSSLSDSALLLFLTSIIEEWSNKVKVWKFVTSSKNITGKNLLQPTDNSTFYGFLQPYDIFGHSSSLSQGGSTSSTQSQLLMAVGVTEWDIPLLEFWSSNFSQ